MKARQTAQVILPSGQVVELIYVSGGDAGHGAADPAGAAAEPAVPVPPRDDEVRLECCPACGGTLVHPVWWEELDELRWTVERRCPSCEWRQVGEFTQEVVDRFDDVLADATQTMLRSLRTMTRANMAHDVERLIAAIDSGDIEPIDF